MTAKRGGPAWGYVEATSQPEARGGPMCECVYCGRQFTGEATRIIGVVAANNLISNK